MALATHSSYSLHELFMNTTLIVFAALLTLKLMVELWLALLNQRSVLKARGMVPPAFREMIDEATYVKSVNYTLARNRFAMLNTIFQALLLGTVILTGLLPWAFGELTGWLGVSVWAQAGVLIILGAALALPGLPLDYWEQFHLEERFGFNKSTVPLWVMDKIKGAAMTLMIGYPLLCAVLGFFTQQPQTWWLWGFGLFWGLQLLIMVVYPIWILPLFNRLEELPEGALRDRLMQLATSARFRVRGIQVMDGSRRSGHSNAFFCGLGHFRRIVLFDTLLEQLKPEEVEAVLAHEIGHYRLGHIPKMLLFAGGLSFIGFATLGWLAQRPWFFENFGFVVDTGTAAPALLLFGLLGGLATFWLTPLFNQISRRHEFAADAFAKQSLKNGAPLVDALRKLSEKNLSNLTPHPFYSGFYYSHPTLLEREAALQEP